MIKVYLYAYGTLLPDGEVVRHVVARVDLDVLPPKGTTLHLPDGTRFVTNGDVAVDVRADMRADTPREYFVGGRPYPPSEGFDTPASLYEAVEASAERRRAGILVRFST